MVLVDLHSHILPGLDDGPQELTDSIKIARDLSRMGFSHIVTTPHYIKGHYQTTSLSVKEKLDLLQTAIDQAGIPLTLLAGNEVYFDSALETPERVAPFHRLGGSTYVLLEAPFNRFDLNVLYHVIGQLQANGLGVVIAHPERATELNQDFNRCRDLADQGVKFQLNMTSLIGKYGSKAQTMGERLLHEKMVYGIGSDVHRVDQTMTLIPQALAALKKLITPDDLRRIQHQLALDLGIQG